MYPLDGWLGLIIDVATGFDESDYVGFRRDMQQVLCYQHQCLLGAATKRLSGDLVVGVEGVAVLLATVHERQAITLVSQLKGCHQNPPLSLPFGAPPFPKISPKFPQNCWERKKDL